MSIVYTADIFCDGECCNQWVHGIALSHNDGLSRRAHKTAKKQGWGRVVAPNGKLLDLCPRCFREWKEYALERKVQSKELPSAEGADQAPRRLQDYARLR